MAETLQPPMPPAKYRWLLPILLPVNLLCVLPCLLLWLTGYTWQANYLLLTVIGLILLLCGMSLGSWTLWLFHAVGHGTPAPWDPPRRLVVAGPYRHVRNPMLTSAFIILTAEALLFNSWPIFMILIVFATACMFYFPLVEEKGLAVRFGDDYQEYLSNVPRWIPRLKPWRKFE